MARLWLLEDSWSMNYRKLNPRVRCAFGNVFNPSLIQAALHYKEPSKLPNSCPYKLSFTQLWKIPWKCFPLLLWKRACASFVPPPGFLASQPGLDKFLARAARSGCFGEELESSSSCILTVRKWNWMLFKLRQKIRTKGLAVCTLCTHLSHPIQMIHPLHSEQTKYAWLGGSTNTWEK